MRAGLERNLRTIFAGEEASIVTDEPRLVDWLATHGLPATTFDEVLAEGATVPRHALLIPLDYQRMPPRFTLRDVFAETSALWLPLASFSSDLEEAKYAIGMFAEMDLVKSVAKSRRVMTRLLMAPDEVTFSGPDTAMKLRLPTSLQLVGRTRLGLLHDEHAAIGNYFEVGTSPTDMSGNIDTELSLSGTFRIDSVLVAKHREIRSEGAAAFLEAAAVAAELRAACPMQITIRDNRIVDGLGPWSERVDALSGPQYGGAVTEVAVGTGMFPLDRVDWNLNCVLNEGATGIHIGVGNGLNGLHFDFISKEAQLDGL